MRFPPARPVFGPAVALFCVLFALVVLTHATLLQLPYFWDEGGYYVPAALDFYHRWTLIPTFTNAHPPLPNVVIGLTWHVFGVHIVVTRLIACAFAAFGLLAVFKLGQRLLGRTSGAVLTALTAAYPIWFAQSSLAHADIFAAGFTLAALALYITTPEQRIDAVGIAPHASFRRLVLVGALFCLAVLSKETALLQPAVLASWEVWSALHSRDAERRAHLRWLPSLCIPLPVLASWYVYHRIRTGFTFGNPTYLQYNATGNMHVEHVVRAFCYRFLHLFWQRNMWLPLLLAGACLFLPVRPGTQRLSRRVLCVLALLVGANWIAFSVLGGALLTRYLLPVYPLLLLVCVATWQRYTARWPLLAGITFAAFLSALWLNPPTFFAPEDNLTYRDMIVVHQAATRYLEQHYPDATVLTAWPASAELTRPELGYTQRTFKVDQISDFSPTEIRKAADHPGSFDTALVFSAHYVTPAYRQYLLRHPHTKRGEEFARTRDLSPREVAFDLGGRVVWEDDRGGEWAAILRFTRDYDASLRSLTAPTAPGTSATSIARTGASTLR